MQPCDNGGSCIQDTSALYEFRCYCLAGWTGNRCNTGNRVYDTVTKGAQMDIHHTFAHHDPSCIKVKLKMHQSGFK